MPQLNSAIIIPEGTEVIGEDDLCTSTAETLCLPASVKEIWPGAFSMFPFIRKITVDKKNKRYESHNNCLIDKKYNRVIVCCNDPVIPDGIESIGLKAMEGRIRTNYVSIPASVREILVTEGKIDSELPHVCKIGEKGESLGTINSAFCVKEGSYAEVFAKEHGIKYYNDSEVDRISEDSKLWALNLVKAILNRENLTKNDVWINIHLLDVIIDILDASDNGNVFHYMIGQGMTEEEIAQRLIEDSQGTIDGSDAESIIRDIKLGEGILELRKEPELVEKLSGFLTMSYFRYIKN